MTHVFTGKKGHQTLYLCMLLSVVFALYIFRFWTLVLRAMLRVR